MLAAFFGDTHGYLDLMYSSAQEWQERTGLTLSFIVQVGDFGIWPDPDKIDKATAYHMTKDGMKLGGDFQDYLRGEKQIPLTTFFCRGNHSDQVYLREKERELEKASPHNFWSRSIEVIPSLFYIPDGHVIEIGGDSPVHYVPGGIKIEHITIRMAAWGGNFAWKTWEQDLPYWRTDGRRLNHMTKDRFAKLLNQRCDVLITHDGPSDIGLRGKTHVKGVPQDEMTGNGVPQIRELIEKSGCRYSFSGHWHQFIRTEIGRSKHTALSKVHPGGNPSEYMVVVEL